MSWKKKFTKDNYFNYGRKLAMASNVFFMCVSTALFIGGFVVRFGTQTINSTTLQKITDSARNAYGVYLSTDNFRPITESLYQTFGIALILIGLFTAPFGVLGFYSLYHKKRILLIVHVVIVGCLLFIQVVMGYHFINRPETIQEWMKPYLREKIKEYYGIDSSDQASLGWNYLMQEYQCCGIDSKADFQYSSYFTRNGCYYYYYYYAVPGCCKTLPSTNAYSYGCGYQLYCGSYSWDTNVWQDGCLQALYTAYYSRNIGKIWALLSIGELIQILLMVFAVTLIKHTKSKIEPLASSGLAESQIWTAESDAVASGHNQLPPIATTFEQKPPSVLKKQPQTMTVTTPGQRCLTSNQMPPTTILAAAPAPQPQPALQSAPTGQYYCYPVQPFLPGAVMLLPSSLDHSQMTRQNVCTAMSPKPADNIPTPHVELRPKTAKVQLAPLLLEQPHPRIHTSQPAPLPLQLSPPRTPTVQLSPLPSEQPIYVGSTAAIQPEHQRSLTVVFVI